MNQMTKVGVALVVSLLSITMLTSCVCKRGGKGGLGDGTSPGDSIPTASADGPLKDINFDYDSSELSSTATRVLSSNASWIKSNPDSPVKVEGHCDERGTNEYNLALGQRRAQSTFDFLRSLGVSSSQLSIITYGEEMPLDPGHTEGAWAKNRRVHFAVSQ